MAELTAMPPTQTTATNHPEEVSDVASPSQKVDSMKIKTAPKVMKYQAVMRVEKEENSASVSGGIQNSSSGCR